MDAFISYSHNDYLDSQNKEIPGNIISKIKKAFTAAGLSFWIDEEGISGGDKEFPAIIAENILKSSCVVFVSTHNSNTVSKWTAKEISLAINNNIRVIPFRCDDTPFRNGIQLMLADVDIIDATVNIERAINKLVKTIVDQKQAKLKEEEAQRAAIEREKAAKERAAKLKDEIAKAKEELKILADNKDALRRALARLSGEYSAACSDYSKNQNRIKEVVNFLTENGEHVNHLLSDYDSEPDIDELKSEISQLKSEIEALKSEIAEIEDSRKALQGRTNRMRIILVVISAVAGIIVGYLIGRNVADNQVNNSVSDTVAVIEEVESQIAIDETFVPPYTNEMLESHVATEGFVDMGTSSLWAACNYGASSPDQKGDKVVYNDISGRIIPSKEDFNALVNGSEMVFGTYKEAKGVYFVSKTTKNCIFFPVTGCDKGKSKEFNKERAGYYWTNSLKRNSTDEVLAFVVDHANKNFVWDTVLLNDVNKNYLREVRQ